MDGYETPGDDDSKMAVRPVVTLLGSRFLKSEIRFLSKILLLVRTAEAKIHIIKAQFIVVEHRLISTYCGM